MNQNENEKSMKEIAEDVQSIAKQAGHEAKETVKDFAHAAADATNEAVEDVKDAAHQRKPIFFNTEQRQAGME